MCLVAALFAAGLGPRTDVGHVERAFLASALNARYGRDETAPLPEAPETLPLAAAYAPALPPVPPPSIARPPRRWHWYLDADLGIHRISFGAANLPEGPSAAPP